jgi:hypothetical protein
VAQLGARFHGVEGALGSIPAALGEVIFSNDWKDEGVRNAALTRLI